MKDLCLLEGKGVLMLDTVALFTGRCPETDLHLQIASMLAARPRIIDRLSAAP
ncbi:MAG TPA: hypothetical protein VG102_00270 [Candidatus Paceibacterota bacterium]|nr:hypothetical protein [Candidatus Paceibacterota bacterium]